MNIFNQTGAMTRIVLRSLLQGYNYPNKHKVFSSRLILALVFIVLAFSMIRLFSIATEQSKAQSSAIFTFTAAGDYGGNSTRTTAVLGGMNPVKSGADFNLALGDLSYASKKPESAWCDYVKGNTGETFPFELIAGNHESSGAAGNFIDNFALCLPHRLGALSGRYAREYYFDYPLISPRARFINISPALTFPDGKYDYTVGSTHYSWVVAAIDSARVSGIDWIVVTMHQNCISMGKKPCTIGEDLFNLLISKKVDLILQGHDHNYQRSKQLALGSNCSRIVKTVYNPGCVADDGSDDRYLKGAGPVLVIVGTGGIGNYDINSADSEAGYFTSSNGVHTNPTTGFLKVLVSETAMNISFNPMYGPNFTDSFIIEDSSRPTITPIPTDIPIPTPTVDPLVTPTEAPTPTLTPTPSPTPLVTPMPLTVLLNPIADTFVNSNSPNSKFGANTLLKVIGGSVVKVTYLKFDLSSLTGKSILSASLRLYIANGSKSVQTVNNIIDNTWQESVVTYNTRPALGSAIASFSESTSGTWKEITITPFVNAAAGQLFSLGIASAGTDGLEINSKENAANKPELVIIYN